jgi:hypothetical protein
VEREASKRREALCRINLPKARSFFSSVAAMAVPTRYSVVERSSLARGGAGEADLRRDGEIAKIFSRWELRAFAK